MADKPPRHEIKVVLFDAAGTLFGLRESVGDTYTRLANEGGMTQADPARIEAAFRREFKGMRPMTGPGRAWWRELVERTFRAAGLLAPAAGFSEAVFLKLFSHYENPEAWRLYPGTRKVLGTLRARGFRLGVVSNFDERLHPVVRGLGLDGFFEHVLTSAEEGAAKPDPRIFEAAWKRFRARPDACLHVGDDPEADWRGAREAGLRTYRLDRRRNDLSGVLAEVEKRV